MGAKFYKRFISKSSAKYGLLLPRLYSKGLFFSVFINTLLFADTQNNQQHVKQYKVQAATVTATRVPTTIDEAPGNVSVISKKDINIRPNLKIAYWAWK